MYNGQGFAQRRVKAENKITIEDFHLIQSGGGTGPEKPRQPVPRKRGVEVLIPARNGKDEVG